MITARRWQNRRRREAEKFGIGIMRRRPSWLAIFGENTGGHRLMPRPPEFGTRACPPGGDRECWRRAQPWR